LSIRRCPLHRNLEPRLHPVQREPRRLVQSVARQARGHRHGLRACHQHHSMHKRLQRFRQRKISNYETDIFRPIFDKLEELSGKKYGSTLPNVGQASRLSQTSEKEFRGKRWRQARCLSYARANRHGHRVSGDCRPHPHAFVCDCRRHPARQQRPQLRSAPHPAPRRALRPHARLPRTVLLQACGRARDTMGDVFPEIRARKKHVQEVIRTRKRRSIGRATRGKMSRMN